MVMPFGNPPGPMNLQGISPPAPDGSQQAAQAITAALLMAAKSGCNCQACQILKGVIDKMAEPFLQKQPGV